MMLLVPLLLALANGFPRTNPLSSLLRLRSVLDDSLDLSDGKSKLIKKLVRQGNRKKGFPSAKDTIELRWDLRFQNGTAIGSSQKYENATNELFSFVLGANPRQVIQGWEEAVYRMLEGEIASLFICSEYAFGEKGLIGFVPPNTDIESTLEIVNVIPALTKRFKSVGADESIKDELIESIQSGQSPISEDYRRNEPATETTSKENIRFFDEQVHRVDPNQRVSGVGRGHRWEETAADMEVEVDLPDALGKGDLLVEIRPGWLSVRTVLGGVLLEGALQGRVVPSVSSWAIAEADPAAGVLLRRLQLSLSKGHGSRDIWATVLLREDSPESPPV